MRGLKEKQPNYIINKNWPTPVYSYKERLLFLKLPSLYYRGYCGDVIITFNLIHCYLILDSSLFFTLSHTFTREHQFILYKSGCTRDARHHVFCHRVNNKWNSLPQKILDTTNTNTFKQHFDKCIIC